LDVSGRLDSTPMKTLRMRSLQAIRDRGVKISSVRERGEQRRPDEVHLATARREHRFLLTKDKDFLDDKRFPLQKRGQASYTSMATSVQKNATRARLRIF
jgi:predicted nuclease of predicted toxin-antitoxin system